MQNDEPIDLESDNPTPDPRRSFTKSRSEDEEIIGAGLPWGDILRRTLIWLTPLVAVVFLAMAVVSVVIGGDLESEATAVRTIWVGMAPGVMAERVDVDAAGLLQETSSELAGWAAARRSVGGMVEGIAAAPTNAKLLRLVIKGGMAIDMGEDTQRGLQTIRPYRSYEVQWVGAVSGYGSEIDVVNYMDSLSSSSTFSNFGALQLQGVLRPKVGADYQGDRRDFGVHGASGRVSM